MPRQPRVLCEGALYHVYNRASHGAPIFSEPNAGQVFVELLAKEVIGDDHRVYAWTLMPNHYHVVLRSSAVSLARTFGKVQSSFGRWRNRVLDSRGPTWQGRYKAKLVEDEGYLMQLIAYVHLNPVNAGLVNDPAEHKFNGHREILGHVSFGLVSRDAALSCYGDTEKEALRNYGLALTKTRESSEEWLRSRPGRLPWWGRVADRPLENPDLVAWVDVDGRPNREPRPKLGALDFVQAACNELGISLDALTARSRRRDLTVLRFLIVGLGIERWGQRAGDLAEVFDRRADFVSWWAKRARDLRLSDRDWATRYDTIDENLRRRFED